MNPQLILNLQGLYLLTMAYKKEEFHLCFLENTETCKCQLPQFPAPAPCPAQGGRHSRTKSTFQDSGVFHSPGSSWTAECSSSSPGATWGVWELCVREFSSRAGCRDLRGPPAGSRLPQGSSAHLSFGRTQAVIRVLTSMTLLFSG